jgi:hypothetical protein
MDHNGSDWYHRRSSVLQQEKIDELIGEEADSKTRLMLMVMSNINKSIVANTELTNAIYGEVKVLKFDLDSHISLVLAEKNQTKGATKILKVAGPALWAIMAGVIATMYHHYDTFQVETNTTLQSIMFKVNTIETRLNDK